MNQLATYLEREGLTQSAFGELIKVRQATVSRLVAGSQLPSLGLAIRIERETHGAVPAVSWVENDAAA